MASRTIYPTTVGGDLQGTPWGAITITDNKIIIDVWARTWKGYRQGEPTHAYLMTMPGYKQHPINISHDGEANFRAYGEITLDPSFTGYRISQIGMLWNNNFLQAGGVTFKDEPAAYITAADINTAPSAPGAFASPTGVLTIGQTTNVAWGASNDAQGGVLTYELGVSVNGGAYNVLTNTTGGHFSYPVPESSSVRFRVRAVDTGGLWSGYTESNTFSVVRPNTAPSIPGVFASPTGELEIGDVKTISWGASNDAEGGVLTYELGVSVNGGAYNVLTNTTGVSYSYTIPTATSLKFRVRTVDNGGLWSTYRESNVFTVTKPKYYWSKYNSTPVYENSYRLTSWYGSSPASGTSITGGTWYSIDSGGTITVSGSATLVTQPSDEGKYVYKVAGNMLFRYVIFWDQDYNKYVIRYSTAEAVSNGPTLSGYTRGSLVQSNIIAVEDAYPTNGRHNADGYWYVRGSRVNNSISPPGIITQPVSGQIFRPSQAVNIAFNASSASNISLYEVDYKYNENPWSNLAYNNTLTRSLSITTDKSLTSIQFRIRAKNTSNVYSDYIYSEVFKIQHNVIPVLTLNTPDNQNLYENSEFIISGEILDTDSDILTIKCQFNAGTTIQLLSQQSYGQSIQFSKKLIVKLSKLYDNDDYIILLKDGANRLDIWVEDGNGGRSNNRTITINMNRFVKPTRLSIKTVAQAMNIEAKSLIDLKPSDYDGKLSLSNISDYYSNVED